MSTDIPNPDIKPLTSEGKKRGKTPKEIKVKKNRKKRNTKGIPDTSNTTATAVKIFKPTLPTVNMTPPAVELLYKKIALFKKITISILGTVLFFISAAAGNLVLGVVQETTNERVFQEIEDLRAQSGSLEPYRIYVDGIELLTSNMDTVMSQDLDMGIILSEITEAARTNNVTISSLRLNETLSGAEANNCVDSDPSNTSQQIGCIVISGSAATRNNVLNFLSTVEETAGLDNSFISSIGSQGSSITFEGTITIRRDLFTERFDFLKTPVNEIVTSGGIKRDESFERYTTGAPVLDPRFTSCFEAIVAGFGPYQAGIDSEYGFYASEDTTGSGFVCEEENYPEAVEQRNQLQQENATQEETIEGEN